MKSISSSWHEGILPGEDGNAVDDTIVYNYVLSADGNTMTVDIQYALPDGNTWTFIYSKQ